MVQEMAALSGPADLHHAWRYDGTLVVPAAAVDLESDQIVMIFQLYIVCVYLKNKPCLVGTFRNINVTRITSRLETTRETNPLHVSQNANR